MCFCVDVCGGNVKTILKFSSCLMHVVRKNFSVVILYASSRIVLELNSGCGRIIK